jgi:predicted Zn-dependent protease
MYYITKRFYAFLIISLCGFIITSCSVNPVTGKKELSLMGEGQEIALGQQSDPQIIATFGLYNDKDLQSFIDQHGQSMAKISHRSHLDYKFRILDSPVVNAFAVPGGYVYFTRGIMAHFNNEAEFAGVLGHEIGHIAAKHSARQYSSQMLAQIGFIAGMVLSEEFRQFSDVAAQSMGLMFLKFSRNHESESDQLGVEYSTKVGYDAHYMGDFFNTLHRLSTDDGKKDALPEFMSTHPDPLNRYENVHAMAKEWQAKDPKSSYNVNRNQYLQMIDGLVYGEDPRQGYEENGYFYHPELLFQYRVPANWQLVNTPSQVQMGEPDGKAAMYLSLAEGATLQDAMQKELESNKLTLVESSNKTVNGFQALAAVSEQVGQDQQGKEVKIKVLSYFIKYGVMIYKFTGITYDTTFQQFFSTFENSMKSFKKLTDQSKINRKPERIKVVTATSNSSLQQLLNRHKVPSAKAQEVSILNGMKLTDQVTTGTMIKILGK